MLRRTVLAVASVPAFARRTARAERKSPERAQARRTSAHRCAPARFGVDALTALVADSGGLSGPVFVNRAGGWVSLANMRGALRAALPDEL